MYCYIRESSKYMQQSPNNLKGEQLQIYYTQVTIYSAAALGEISLR